MSEGYVDVTGGKLHFKASGQGDSLVLIHAGYMDSRMWEAEVKYLSPKYTVLTYDVRGFGKSSTPEGEYSDFKDLKSLLAFEGVGKAIIIGMSNGGRIALDFAVEFPDMLRALVLVNSGVRGVSLEGSDEDLWGDMEGIEKRYNELASQKKYREAAAVDVDYWSHRLSAQDREKVLDIAQDNTSGPDSPIEKYQKSPEPPAFARLDKINVPVLIMKSGDDKKGMQQVGEKLHQAMKSSRLEIIEEADHLPNISQPKRFREALEDFLKSLP